MANCSIVTMLRMKYCTSSNRYRPLQRPRIRSSLALTDRHSHAENTSALLTRSSKFPFLITSTGILAKVFLLLTEAESYSRITALAKISESFPDWTKVLVKKSENLSGIYRLGLFSGVLLRQESC